MSLLREFCGVEPRVARGAILAVAPAQLNSSPKAESLPLGSAEALGLKHRRVTRRLLRGGDAPSFRGLSAEPTGGVSPVCVSHAEFAKCAEASARRETIAVTSASRGDLGDLRHGRPAVRV